MCVYKQYTYISADPGRRKGERLREEDHYYYDDDSRSSSSSRRKK
jgi:hypothetical protein